MLSSDLATSIALDSDDGVMDLYGGGLNYFLSLSCKTGLNIIPIMQDVLLRNHAQAQRVAGWLLKVVLNLFNSRSLYLSVITKKR